MTTELETKRDELIAERTRLDTASKHLQAQLSGIESERGQIRAETVNRLHDEALEGRTADIVDLAYRVSVLDLTAEAIPPALERLQDSNQSLALRLQNVQRDLVEAGKVEYEKRLKDTARQVKDKHGTLNPTAFFSRVRDAMNDPHLSEQSIKRAMGWR